MDEVSQEELDQIKSDLDRQEIEETGDQQFDIYFYEETDDQQSG